LGSGTQPACRLELLARRDNRPSGRRRLATAPGHL